LSTVVLLATSLVAFLPFSRDVSFSNYMIYALLPVVFLVSNKKRFEGVPSPDGLGLAISVTMIAGSFVFNWATGVVTGSTDFGLTDYVLLVAGVFSAFFSILDTLAMMCVGLLAFLRGATLSLSLLYPYVFIGVSAFFVSVVLFFSHLLISPEMYEGPVAGQLVVGGAAGGAIVGIGWGCAGLEELVLIGVILFVLIWSFNLSRGRSIAWLLVGLLGSFVINIFRMVTLVWVAYRYGLADMLWVHTHLGDVMFLAWIAVFWLVFFRFEQQAPRDGGDVSDAPDAP